MLRGGLGGHPGSRAALLGSAVQHQRGGALAPARARAATGASRPDRCRRAGFPLVAAAAGPFPLPASAGPHPPPRRPLSRLRRVPARAPAPRASALPPPTFRATAARSRAQVAGAPEPPRGRAAGLPSFPTTPHPAAPGAWGGRARAGGAQAGRRRRGFRLWLAQRRQQRSRTDAGETGGGRRRRREGSCMHETHR